MSGEMDTLQTYVSIIVVASFVSDTKNDQSKVQNCASDIDKI